MPLAQPVPAIIEERGNVGVAVKRLRALLVPQESLEAVAAQRRVYALTHRRVVAGATSGRLMILRRGLFGGFQVADIRWQDLKEAQLRVGIIGATLRVLSLGNSDLAVAGRPEAVTEITGLRKGEAQRLYTICQAHEQAWREKRRIRELEELRAKSGGVTLGGMHGMPAMPEGGDDPVARLERAKEMLDKGLISDAEYEAIKARLVSSL